MLPSYDSRVPPHPRETRTLLGRPQVPRAISTEDSAGRRRSQSRATETTTTTTNDFNGSDCHRSDTSRWETCLSMLGLEDQVNHHLAEVIPAWLSGDPSTEVEGGDAKPSSNGAASPVLVGVALVAALLLSTPLSWQQPPPPSLDACMSEGGPNRNDSWYGNCDSKVNRPWGSGFDDDFDRESHVVGDIVFAFVATATRDSHDLVRSQDEEDPKPSGVCTLGGGNITGVRILGRKRCCSGRRSSARDCPCDLDCGVETGAGDAREHGRDVIDKSDSDSGLHVPNATELDLRVVVASDTHALPGVEWKRKNLNEDRGRFVSRTVSGNQTRGGDQRHAQAYEESVSLADGEELGGGVGVNREEEVREFVGLWTWVQASVWHVNTCLAVLGLADADRSGEGCSCCCTAAVDPRRLRPALALEVFRKRRDDRKIHQSVVAKERKRRRRPVDYVHASPAHEVQKREEYGARSGKSSNASQGETRAARKIDEGRPSVTNRGSRCRSSRSRGDGVERRLPSRFWEGSRSKPASDGKEQRVESPRESCCFQCSCWSCRVDYECDLRVRAVLEAVAVCEA